MVLAENEKVEFKPNKQQQECIDNIDGKYLVLAGPGTGKTFTVTRRIKAMLEKGIKPERILCLTFSETAAGEMKNKLIQAFDGVDVNINIYTYHGFCNEIIGNYAELFELPEDYRIIKEPISRQFLKECIEEYQPKYYRNTKNDPYVYLKIITNKIAEIKKYRYTKDEYFYNLKHNPDWEPKILEYDEKIEEAKSNPKSKAKQIEKMISEKEELIIDIEKAKEIWEFYERYKAKMEKENYIDFDDMIGFVLDKFESSPAFLEKIASKYDYIMVDEYQDTNESQNKIVFNLVSKSNNVFVVGDDDQIIFSFQGANLDTIQGFLKHFPDTKVICLTENMRSTQSILDVARVVSKQDDRRLEINPEFKIYNINKDLTAKNKEIIAQDKKVRCTAYQDVEEEYNCIVNDIEKIINSDTCPIDKKTGEKKLSEIAIIATSHDQLGIFADKLKDKNIPVELKDGKSIFEIKSSITLFYYLQMLANPELYSDKILKLLLLAPFKIHPCDFGKIYQNLSAHKTFIETIRSIKSWEEEEKINKFISTYDELQVYVASESLRNIIMEVGAKTGIIEYFLNEEINKNDNIAGLKKLIDEAKDFSEAHNDISLVDFIEYLLMIQADKDIDIKTDKPPITMNAVQLTTYHSSKGKEYEYVFMPTLLKNRWESSSKSFKPIIPVSTDKYKSDDEWREYKLSDRVKTMYVGMTRAKHDLRLSYYLYSGKKTSTASSWILAAKDLMDCVTTPERSIETQEYVAKSALIKREYDYKRDFKYLVQSRMNGRAYSPSLLRKYQACPRQFLYGDILKFDSRIGFADAANYGNAVHGACEFMVNEAIKNGCYPTKEEFLDIYRKEFNNYVFSSVEQRKIYFDRGENELDKFYHFLTNTAVKNLYATEYAIETEIEGLKFYGRIDKLDRNDDGSFNIIDYKTSDEQSLTSIAYDGVHKDYYSQMCLYKYAFEKATGKKVKETSFVFPINSSITTLELTDEECFRVVEDLKKTAKSIENCEFEPSFDKNACKYCGYKDFCAMEIV